jgi:hypothetical protein
MQTEFIPGYCESFGTSYANFSGAGVRIQLVNLSTGYSDFNGTNNVECFDSYNASSPLYSDVSVDNTYDRQWDWFLCSGFGWYVSFLL